MAFSLIIPIVQGTGLFVFQRRDDKAPTDANLLGFFGGSIEAGETPLEAAARELGEETSLQFSQENLRFCLDADMPTQRGPAHAHLYMITIPGAPFDTYEGAGYETFSKAEVLERTDLAPAARHLLQLLPK